MISIILYGKARYGETRYGEMRNGETLYGETRRTPGRGLQLKAEVAKRGAWRQGCATDNDIEKIDW